MSRSMAPEAYEARQAPQPRGHSGNSFHWQHSGTVSLRLGLPIQLIGIRFLEPSARCGLWPVLHYSPKLQVMLKERKPLGLLL